MKDAIRLGDSTTHGGKVLEAFSRTDLNGKPIAGVGHKVSCPLCKGQRSGVSDQRRFGNPCACRDFRRQQWPAGARRDRHQSGRRLAR